jgi:hypothetical protein
MSSVMRFDEWQDSNGVPVLDGTGGGLQLGKILQVQSTTLTNPVVVSGVGNTPIAVSGLSVTITPHSSSSKILVLYTVAGGSHADYLGALVRVFRGSTEIMRSDTIGPQLSFGLGVTAGNVLDSPATNSSTVYEIRVVQGVSTGTPVYVNRNEDNNQFGHSTITVMEVAA